MLDGIRGRVAGALSILAERVSAEPRRPGESRIARGYRTTAGVAITPDTAVTVSTVWACKRYLRQTVGVLPWHVMRKVEKGAEIVPGSLDYLISTRPNPEWSSFQFRETLTDWALGWGNGWGEIERDQARRPLAIWPIHPERAQLCRDPDSGELYLEVDNGSGKPKAEIPYGDVFHIRGFGEGPVGVNVITYAAETIGWAKAAQMFGSTFFGGGANFSTVVVNKKPFANKAAARRQREEMEQLHKGPRNAHKLAILDNDSEVKRLGLNAEESQLVETHQHLVEEICRWFGVPPHKVMHLLRATFSNIEHQAIEVVVDSVSPWVKRFEDEADFKLFARNRRGLYTKMNMRALMRGDAKTRGEYYKLMREVGAYNANRILELEDENTIGKPGDKHVMQSQYTTLDRIGEPPVPSVPPPPAAEDELEEDAAAQEARAAFEREFMVEDAHV